MKFFARLLIAFTIILVVGCSQSSSDDRKLERARDAGIVAPMPDIRANLDIKPIETRSFISGGYVSEGWDLQISSGSAVPSALGGNSSDSAFSPRLHIYRRTEKECDLAVQCLSMLWIDNAGYSFGIVTVSKSKFPGSKVDFTKAVQDEELLAFRLKLLKRPQNSSEDDSFRVNLGSSMDAGRGSFSTNFASVDIGYAMAKVPTDEWVHIGVPLSCFVGEDFDISDVSHISLIGFGGTETMMEAVSIAAKADIIDDCSK